MIELFKRWLIRSRFSDKYPQVPWIGRNERLVYYPGEPATKPH